MSHLLPRYTQARVEPVSELEQQLARRAAEAEAARQRIAAGTSAPVDPASLRGIPCTARGVGGTSPGTNPATAVLRLDGRHR